MNDNDFSYENTEPKKKGRLSTVIGIIYLAFFVITFITTIVSAEKGNTFVAVICVGLIFFVTGLFSFFTPKPSLKKAPALIFPVVGGCMIAIPILQKYTDFTFEISADLATGIVTGVFLIIGLCFIFIPTITYIYKKTHCVPVMAVCKGLDMRYSRSKNGGRRKIYAPLWEYYYNGQFYTHQSNSYSNIDVPQVDCEYELYIDPEKPEKYYRPSTATLIFFIIFGSVWTLFSLLMILSF